MSPQLIAGEAAPGSATVRAMRAGELVALARLEGGELSPVRVFHLNVDAAPEQLTMSITAGA